MLVLIFKSISKTSTSLLIPSSCCSDSFLADSVLVLSSAFSSLFSAAGFWILADNSCSSIVKILISPMTSCLSLRIRTTWSFLNFASLSVSFKNTKSLKAFVTSAMTGFFSSSFAFFFFFLTLSELQASRIPLGVRSNLCFISSSKRSFFSGLTFAAGFLSSWNNRTSPANAVVEDAGAIKKQARTIATKNKRYSSMVVSVKITKY